MSVHDLATRSHAVVTPPNPTNLGTVREPTGQT